MKLHLRRVVEELTKLCTTDVINTGHWTLDKVQLYIRLFRNDAIVYYLYSV